MQLYRKVKALPGFNGNDYILTIRMQKARLVRLNEDLSMSEIAYEVGSPHKRISRPSLNQNFL